MKKAGKSIFIGRGTHDGFPVFSEKDFKRGRFPSVHISLDKPRNGFVQVGFKREPVVLDHLLDLFDLRNFIVRDQKRRRLREILPVKSINSNTVAFYWRFCCRCFDIVRGRYPGLKLGHSG